MVLNLGYKKVFPKTRRQNKLWIESVVEELFTFFYNIFKQSIYKIQSFPLGL